METRKPGFYWIKRNEPDGPSVWEPAQYVLSHLEVGVVNARNLGPCWYVIGTGYPQREVAAPASNAWLIGARIEHS